MKYVSTRGAAPILTFDDVLLTGLARDGGLYVPAVWPEFSPAEIATWKNLEQALDVLADLTLAPLLSDNDLELEREVILEEIAQVQDTPDDLVFEMHSDQLWQGHPYGRSILGTKASVSKPMASPEYQLVPVELM